MAKSDQIVDRRCKGEHPADPFEAAISGLARQTHRLDPAKDLFHPLALSLTDGVARVPSRATINGTGPILLGLAWRTVLSRPYGNFQSKPGIQ
jgi:hypothetical protein